MMGVYRCNKCGHIFTEDDILERDDCPNCESYDLEEDADLEKAYEIGYKAIKGKLQKIIRTSMQDNITAEQIIEMLEEIAYDKHTY